jgi:hypothetical protein
LDPKEKEVKKNTERMVVEADGDQVEHLRKSPIRGLTPISPDPIEIPLDVIENDPTNPGLDETKSRRYLRRADSLLDSIDIIGAVVYPVVVCQMPKDPTRYILIDGHGRKGALKGRGVKTVRAIVYPPLTAEQRICLRETLNSAQEPFDAVSVLRDLWRLGDERGLKLEDPEQVKMLVRDLPQRVRKYHKDLILLGRWPREVVDKIGESYELNGQAIGIDKIRALDRVVAALHDRHPKTLKRLGGEQAVYVTLAQMYGDGKFREGARSQQAIRDVTKAVKALRPDHEKVFEFFDQQQSWTALSDEDISVEDTAPDLVKACQQFTAQLLEVEDPDQLSPKERRALERTAAVLEKVLPRA